MKGLKNFSLLRWVYSRNLSEEQKVQFFQNLDIIEQDLAKFKKDKLKYWKYAQAVSILCMYWNVLISSKLFSFLVFMGPIYIIMAILITTYIYHKEMDFIRNYDLKGCNPKILIKGLLALKSTGAYAAITGGITLGSVLIADNIYEKFTGFSLITQTGKWLGIHKDSPKRVRIRKS